MLADRSAFAPRRATLRAAGRAVRCLEVWVVAPNGGEFVSESLDYDRGRSVTAYVPSTPAEAVVFAADGGWHLSRLVDAIEAASVPSTMIVGVHGLDDDEGRFREYVPAVDPDRFRAHEDFVVRTVRGWVQERLGSSPRAERTAVWGASLGGEFALAMGTRHPDVFGAVFCASPGGGFRPPEKWADDVPDTYLVAGSEEPFFAENAQRWHDAMTETDARVVMTVREGDHGGAFWFTEFPLMVNWAFDN